MSDRMAGDGLAGLQAARARMLRERRSLALRLGNEKIQATEIAGALIQAQQAIEVIDLAIKDESSSGSSIYEDHGLRSV